MKQTVLVTGGLGYIGGRVTAFLAELADINLKVGTRRLIGKKPQWLSNGIMTPMDFNSLESLDNACHGVDCIVHLAALNEVDSQIDPPKALAINGLATLHLLQAAEKAKIRRFIYFSTAHVYGAPLIGHIDEKNLPRPIHPYAITHRTAEDFILAAHDRKALTGVVIRLSNAIGAPMATEVNRWMLLVNDLCRQAVMTRTMVLKSSGVQERNFIAMSDVVRGVQHLIHLPEKHCCDGLFNMGGEASLRILDMAQLIQERCIIVLGFMPELVIPKSSCHEEAKKLYYHIDKLKQTGFSPMHSLANEIDATLQFCADSYSQSRGDRR